jgi:Putative peptidoglycan binding domain
LRLSLGILRSLTIAAVSLLLWGTAAASSTSQPTKSSSNSHKSSKSSKSGSKSGKSGKKKTSAKSSSHGQHGIDAERTREIQQALIREHYLSGEPTGKWDQSTKEALTHFQEVNGWQTKSVPDSRALIKLGLGPDKSGLLNPDTAVMTAPHELGASQGAQPGGSAQR